MNYLDNELHFIMVAKPLHFIDRFLGSKAEKALNVVVGVPESETEQSCGRLAASQSATNLAPYTVTRLPIHPV